MRKRILVVLVLALLCTFFVFADAYKDANKYLRANLSDQNLQKVAELAPQLTQDQKEYLYKWNKVDTVMPFAMNLVLGFGSGSFSQGDDGMGILFLVLDTACTGIVIYDIVATGWDNFVNSISGKGDTTKELKASKIALIAAAGIRVWQSIRPFTYANRKNTKLKSALGLDGTTVAFAPIVTDEGMGIALSAKIRY